MIPGERRGERPAAGAWRALALAAALLIPAACAPALREPPPLTELAGTDQVPSAESAADMAAAAEGLFTRRQPRAAREAAGLWLRAALHEPGRADALAAAARALVWLVDHEPDPERRRQAATTAVDAAVWCRRTAPGSPACDYWLGAALGVQARERPTTGISALPEIADAFKRAAAADPGLESAGPERALALLYVRAPGWPTGPGDPDLGLEYAEAAVARSPGFPPNLMALAEARSEIGDEPGARAAWQAAREAARAALDSGHPDAGEWLADIESALASEAAR